MKKQIVSKAEFARLRHVSRAAVTYWIHNGIIFVNDDGSIDVELANIELARNRDPAYTNKYTKEEI